MRKCANNLVICEEAVSHIWLCNRPLLDIHMRIEENFVFCFHQYNAFQ